MPQLGEILHKYDGAIPVKHKYIWAACEECGKERWVAAVGVENKPRSARCQECGHRSARHSEAFKRLQAKQKGEGHPNWKGGRHIDKGYVEVRIYPDDFFYSMANKAGYVREHRLVVAKALNRCLLPWEIVHHKEGYSKDDNRYPQTLELISAQKYHFVDSKVKMYIKQLEKTIARLKERLECV